MRPPPPRPPVSSSDIEEAHVLGVGLDEQTSRLDLVAHQHREQAIRRRGVLDVDPDQQAPRRIHRRLPELQLVHLAETLEAAELDALLRKLEGEVPQLL